MTDGEDDVRERSDLFSVGTIEPARADSIAPVAEIMLPPEEKRRRTRNRILAAITAVVLLGLSAFAARYFIHASAVQEAVLLAGDTGRAADVDEALDTLDSGEAPGMRARLIASMVLAGERPLADGTTALAEVTDAAEEAAEKQKAQVYLALAAGDATQAWTLAAPIVAAGALGAESAHAKSLSAFAGGDSTNAVAEGAAAATARPAPRYIAQHGLSVWLHGDSAGALARLDGDHPSLRAARVRVLSADFDPSAGELASSLLADETATRSEKAWAQLARARDVAISGDRAGVVPAVDAALELAPPGDDTFVWSAAEALVVAGAFAPAKTLVEPLDVERAIARPALRGWVRAALALEDGDAAAALSHLSTVSASPAALWLVGRAHALAEREGAARGALARATEGPLGAFALESAAALELDAGNAEQAATHAAAALEARGHHPAIVRTAVRAWIAAEDVAAADSEASAALVAHPDDVRVVAANADVALAREDWARALTHLRHAIELDGSDPELHVNRGQAARFAGEADEAEAAYGEALERVPAHPVALVGLLALKVEAHAVPEAETLLARIDAADLEETDELTLLRIRVLLDGGAGQAGIGPATRATRRRGLRRNAWLRLAIAEMNLQAGMYVRAIGMFKQARRLGADSTETQLGIALAWVLEGRLNKTTETIQALVEATTPEEGGESPVREMARMLLTRGRVEANLGRFDNAERYANRSLEVEASNTEAHLLLGEVALRRRRDASEHLRAAIGYPRPQPDAYWHLARRAGTTAEACAFAARYVSAAPRGEFADAARDRVEACEDAASTAGE